MMLSNILMYALAAICIGSNAACGQTKVLEQPTVAALVASFQTLKELGFEPRAFRLFYGNDEKLLQNPSLFIRISLGPSYAGAANSLVPAGEKPEQFFRGPRITVFVCKKTLRAAAYEIDGYDMVQLETCH